MVRGGSVGMHQSKTTTLELGAMRAHSGGRRKVKSLSGGSVCVVLPKSILASIGELVDRLIRTGLWSSQGEDIVRMFETILQRQNILKVNRSINFVRAKYSDRPRLYPTISPNVRYMNVRILLTPY